MQQVRLHHFIARRLFLNMPFPVAVHPHAVTPFFSAAVEVAFVRAGDECLHPSISRSSRVRRVMSSSLITSSSSKIGVSPVSARNVSSCASLIANAAVRICPCDANTFMLRPISDSPMSSR